MGALSPLSGIAVAQRHPSMTWLSRSARAVSTGGRVGTAVSAAHQRPQPWASRSPTRPRPVTPPSLREFRRPACVELPLVGGRATCAGSAAAPLIRHGIDVDSPPCARRFGGQRSPAPPPWSASGRSGECHNAGYTGEQVLLGCGPSFFAHAQPGPDLKTTEMPRSSPSHRRRRGYRGVPRTGLVRP